MVYIFLAPGFEEIEALATVDILRRADIAIKTVAVADNITVSGAHNVPVTADMLFDPARIVDPEMLVLPGGLPGADNLKACEPLCRLLSSAQCPIGAICASPAVVLAPLGLLRDREAICYPGFEDKLTWARVSDNVVVTDGPVTTAAGPGFSMEFALELVRVLRGDDAADNVASGLLLL